MPFLFLALDLPPVPLFTDEFERDVIPQVPLGTLLAKYDGKTVQDVNNELRTYRITSMPPYLVHQINLIINHVADLSHEALQQEQLVG